MNRSRQYCTFLLDKHCFGVPVDEVQEVLRYQLMTSVPLAPRDVCGLVNLRGQIVTVIDLRRRLGLPDRTLPQRGTNVIVQSGDEVISLLVDELGNVQEVEESQFELPPDTLQGVARELIRGTYKLRERLLLVLDVAKVAFVSEEAKSV